MDTGIYLSGRDMDILISVFEQLRICNTRETLLAALGGDSEILARLKYVSSMLQNKKTQKMINACLRKAYEAGNLEAYNDLKKIKEGAF